MKTRNITTHANATPRNCHICGSTTVISCDDYDTSRSISTKMKTKNITTHANATPRNCHICGSTAVISCDDYDTPMIKCTRSECGIFIGARTQNEAISIWNTLLEVKI